MLLQHRIDLLYARFDVSQPTVRIGRHAFRLGSIHEAYVLDLSECLGADCSSRLGKFLRLMP